MNEQEAKERDAARMKAWSETGARVVNLDQASPHRSWIEGFNTAWQSAMDYSQSDGERYRTALERIADQLSDVYVAVGSGDDRVYRSAYESLNMAYKIASEALEGE